MTQRDQERQAFLDAITADRYDQATRLVYADWCNEYGLDAEAEEQRRWTPEWQRAWDWFEKLAADMNAAHGPGIPITVEELLEAGTKSTDPKLLKRGEEGRIVGDDLRFGLRDWYDTEDNRIEYWNNWETVTRKKVDTGDPGFWNREVFRCCY